MSTSNQLKRAKHIADLYLDDLEDLSNDMPKNAVLDKQLQVLIESSSRFLFLVKEEIKKPVQTEQIENKLDQNAFNEVFS